MVEVNKHFADRCGLRPLEWTLTEEIDPSNWLAIRRCWLCSLLHFDRSLERKDQVVEADPAILLFPR